MWVLNRPGGSTPTADDVVMQGQADLLEIVGALHAPGRLARGLYRGQQQSDQHRDDRDDDEKLYQSERPGVSAW